MRTGSSLTISILYRMQHGREACQCHIYIYITRNYYGQFFLRGHLPLPKNLYPLSPQTLQITSDSISDCKFYAQGSAWKQLSKNRRERKFHPTLSKRYCTSAKKSSMPHWRIWTYKDPLENPSNLIQLLVKKPEKLTNFETYIRTKTANIHTTVTQKMCLTLMKKQHLHRHCKIMYNVWDRSIANLTNLNW